MNYDSKNTTLSQITNDQKSLALVGRVLSIGVPRTFTRKNDSRRGVLMHLNLYDGNSTITLSLWDGAVAKCLDDSLDIRPGDLIHFSNAYTRPGLDGLPQVNIGAEGGIEKIALQSNPGIPSIEERAASSSNVSENAKYLVLKGKVEGEVRTNSFNRSDGSSSEYTTFSLSDPDNANSSPSVRVVLWKSGDPALSLIKNGDNITLLNVRTKLATFQNSPGLEVHGGDSTLVHQHFVSTRKWMREKITAPFSETKESNSGDGAHLPIPFVARLIAFRMSENSEGLGHALLLDSQGRKISVTLSKESKSDLESMQRDQIVVCKPESLDYALLKATCTKQNSISKASSRREDIPLSSSLITEVERLTEGIIVSLELICLTEPVGREIQTKDGLVRRTEITVADHTGEIKLYGWRSLSKLLDGFSTGEHVMVQAVEVQSFEGRKFLLLKSYSTVEKAMKSA